MAERMIGVRVMITRYISDDPQPGVVECEFSDANDRFWRFVQKTAMVSLDWLDAESRYPQPGVIGCEILSRRRDEAGREVILIDTEDPWRVAATDGSTRFEVFPASLTEWEWGSKDLKEWDGHA